MAQQLEPRPLTDEKRHGEIEYNPKDPDTYIYDVKSSSTDEKKSIQLSPSQSEVEVGLITEDIALKTTLDYVTKTLDCSDDPTLNPYTVRAFVLGLGLAAFGAVIAEIFYFKPQTILVNTIFLQIIAFPFGEATQLIPTSVTILPGILQGPTTFLNKIWSPIGRALNPGPFNMKEHIFITIMASSAAVCALGTEQLAAQSLYYNEMPNPASAIFLLFSSQMLGYGFLTVTRKRFVYPTKMLWPLSLPMASLFQTLHLDKAIAKKRLKVFWIVLGVIMVYEIIPEYMFPLTIGISIACLVKQNSAGITYLFGGANGDEGLGFLSWCMDWQYIGTDMFLIPIETLFNQWIGYCGCIALTIGVYWANLWNAKTFPFMAQVLFTANGSTYNQTAIMDSDNVVSEALVEEYGLPWFATSNAMSLLVMNMGITAAIVHIICWHWENIRGLFVWAKPSALRQHYIDAKADGRYKFWKESTYVEKFPGTEGDPHFAAMRQYKEVPAWWYFIVLVSAFIIGLACNYQQKTGLPWWAFLIACILSFLLCCFYAPLYAITGFYFGPTSAVQMIGSLLVPGKPVANMEFTLFGANSLVQAIFMLGDLKLAQYAKLPPRATFVAQIVGTMFGAVLNWVMMNSIVDSQREILLSVEGSNIWSGQNVQTYNAQAVAWGGVGHKIFAAGGEYFMVPMGLVFGIFAPLPFWILHKYYPKWRLDTINTSIICTWLGWLSVGINSSLLPYFVFGVFTQYYLRKYRAVWFAKYNLIVTAAIGGGVQIIVFILTFAVFGGSGKAHPFPEWWGNNLSGNVDRCFYAN